MMMMLMMRLLRSRSICAGNLILTSPTVPRMESVIKLKETEELRSPIPSTVGSRTGST